MPATGKSSLPAPHNYEEESRAKRAERKAAFIRETALRFATADFTRDKVMYPTIIDCAVRFANALEEKGYL